MSNEKKQLVKEPIERFEHRMSCKSLGYSGACYKRSGWGSIGDNPCHLLAGCDGKCRRMKLWETKHGFKGVEFKLAEMY